MIVMRKPRGDQCAEVNVIQRACLSLCCIIAPPLNSKSKINEIDYQCLPETDVTFGLNQSMEIDGAKSCLRLAGYSWSRDSYIS